MKVFNLQSYFTLSAHQSQVLFEDFASLFYNTLQINRSPVENKKPQLAHSEKLKANYGSDPAMPVEFPTGFT